MKHFNIWQWADFARALGGHRSGGDGHASAPGCARCEQIVNVLRSVDSTARGEADYEPPAARDPTCACAIR